MTQGKARQPIRKHYKVQKFPKEVIEALNEKLAEGHTYSAIVLWLKKLGYSLHESSLCRYNKQWSKAANEVRKAQEQARVIAQELKDRPNADLAEAAEQILLMRLTNYMVQHAQSLDLKSANAMDIGKLITTLQQSGVQRDRLKLAYKKEVEAKAERLMKDAEHQKDVMTKEELLVWVRERIYGITK